MAEDAGAALPLAGEIGLALDRAASTRAALEIAAAIVARRPGVTLACLFTVEGDGGFLELIATAGHGEPPCEPGARLLIGQDRYGRAVQNGRASVSRDASGCLLGAPVRVGHDVLGLLTIASHAPLPPEFSADAEGAGLLLGQYLDRMRLQDELRESEGRLGLVTDHIPAILWTVDPSLRITASLGRGLRAIGLRPGELVGRTLFDWLGPNAQANPSFDHHLRALAGEVVTYDWKEQGIAFETRLSPLRDAQGRVSGVLGFSVDVSEREREREALRISEQRNRLVVENANEAIVVAQDGRVRFLNGKTEEITGYSRAELLGMPFIEVVHPDDRALVAERHRRRLAGEEVPHFYSFRAMRPDGAVRWVDVNAVTFAWEGRPATLNFFTDVTERERAQAALREADEALHRAQKMESLGLLAGGIAHDFNNLLVAILGHADLATRDIKKGSALAGRIDQIALAATRAAELTQQMLVFAGKGRVQFQAVDLSTLAAEIGDLISPALAATTRIDYALDREAPGVQGDPSQLRQVAMNLLTNASEALESRPGTVTLRTGRLVADRALLASCVLGEKLAAGEYAFLEVEDTGQGVAPETQARMFDPFFTTKFAGRGLGLAATLGIVRGHRGAIHVHSTPGSGTTFRVLLPLAGGPPAAAAPRPCLLALDADAVVLASLKASFREAGLGALTARTAEDGLALLRNEPGIVLALVDTSVLHERPELPRELRAERPSLRILLSSASAQESANVAEADGFMPKPYRHGALIDAVRRAREESA